MKSNLEQIAAKCDDVKQLIANNEIDKLEDATLEIHSMLECLNELTSEEIEDHREQFFEIKRALTVITSSISALKKFNTDTLKNLTNSDLTYEKNLL